MWAQLLLFWIVAMQVMLVLMLEKTINIILAGCFGSRLLAFTTEGTLSPAAATVLMDTPMSPRNFTNG
jgi:hypothetical protein